MSWLSSNPEAIAVVALPVMLYVLSQLRRDIVRADCVGAIIAAWITLPQWYQDREEPERLQRELYRPVATAICAVAKTRQELAFLATQAYAETRLARYVLEDRCSDGPKGARCDEGLATGPWQVHAHCKAAWQTTSAAHWWAPVLSQARLRAGATCARRGFRFGVARCKKIEGGFAAQLGAGRCKAKWAAKRLVLFHIILGRMP